MVAHTAMMFVRQGKAYLPVVAQTEAGLFMGIEPVYMAELTIEDLVAALEKVLTAGHPRVAHPTQEEWPRLLRESPLLRAAKVKSRRAFFQHCVSYDISWTEQAVIVYVSQPDHLGRAELASAKKLSFPKETPLRAIVEAILEDVRSRPELQAAEEGASLNQPASW